MLKVSTNKTTTLHLTFCTRISLENYNKMTKRYPSTYCLMQCSCFICSYF